MTSLSERRCVLIVSTFAAFLTPFMGSSVNVALPAIGAEFSMDVISLSWVASSYLISTAMFIVPFGRFADIYGRKQIFTYGIGLFTFTTFLSAVSPSGMFLVGARFLEGIGSAMIYGTGIAMLTSVYPKEERGKVLGINVTSVYVGLALGPFIGGLITHAFGWRWIFLIIVPMGIFILWIIFAKLGNEWADARGEAFDVKGSVLYSVMLLALMYGFSQLPNPAGFVFITLGVLVFIAFVVLEMRIQSPVLDINLFRNNRTFAFSNLAALINYGATFAIGFLLSLYLQYIKGLTPSAAGLILITQPVIQALFSPSAGKLSDRIEPRLVASAGMTVTVAGLILLSFIEEETPLTYIIVSLALLGFGFALFSSPNTNAVMSSVERKFYGVASGMVATMRTTGMMFSMGIATMIFAIYLGNIPISPEYYYLFIKSVQTVFMLFSILCGIGVFASLARGKVQTSPSQR